MVPRMVRGEDRRRATRVRVVALATLQTTDPRHACDQAVCTVRDISRVGIGLEAGQPPMRGQTVLLRLLLDDRVHELRTRATRVTRRGNSNYYEIGLDWHSCTPEQMAFLDEVLEVFGAQPQH